MGAVLAIVIDVVVAGVAAVVEAAATEAAAALVEVGVESIVEAGEAAAAAAEAAAETAAEAAAEGAAEAASETAAEIASSTAAQIAAKILTYVAKLSKLIKETFEIDAIFKAAIDVLKLMLSDPSVAEKYKKLERAVTILETLNQKMNEIMKWLEDHKNDSVELEGIDVPLESGILAKFLQQLSMALGNMKRLADDINQLNQSKQPIKDAQIITINRSMIRIVSTFESLAQFKEENQSKIAALASLPVSVEEAEEWKRELGSDGGPTLQLLHLTMYKYK
ncbi:uncharacterized protein LOC128618223 [Ictalurus furcatus]|uniref:uncharacterized protein LOC128618223 n=1 Tax=Ictalurus furcatus TaxID=66913 RepID=UPI0023507ED5|nr:uncharacterized protein LOC128618223 [Ictalurus furcatus]XP_053497715.1 uncharacterized protein LOC128618223 [Ictalurus furcatus]XP_053497716.1 uncharacterized protein LOC128618223 [Ictalurus furcatus]